MKQAEGTSLIEKWADLARLRQDVIGLTKAATGGQEFTDCSDIGLDRRLA